MNNPKLVLKIESRKSTGLQMWPMKLYRTDKTTAEWHVTSGTPRNQTRESCWKRNQGLIPASELVQDRYMVQTECCVSRLVSSVGKHLFAILPFTHWSKDGKSKRTNLAIHLDANHVTSPGSAGCIVFTNKISWEQFMVEMKSLSDLGIKEVPLEVIYT